MTIDELRAAGTKHWHDKELHTSNVTMEAIALATGEVVGLPLVQHHLEPISCALRRVRQLLRIAQITLNEAPQVRQLVHAVWMGVLAHWWVVLENCLPSYGVSF